MREDVVTKRPSPSMATDFTVQGWDGVNWVALGTVSGNNPVFAFNLTSSPFVEQLVEVVPPPIGSAPKRCQRVCDARAELIRSAGRFVGKDYP